MDYTLIGSPRTRAFRVLWMLEELGLPYGYQPDAPHSDSVRAANPSGKVPVLLVDDTPVHDSLAIMTYLADAHGALTAPAGTLERAQQDALVGQVNDEMDACLWTAARHSFVLPEAHRLPAIKDSLQWEFARNQTRIAARLDPDGPFALGAEMTLADILLAHCTRWAQGAKFAVTEPRLLAHFEAMSARPAYLRAMAKAA